MTGLTEIYDELQKVILDRFARHRDGDTADAVVAFEFGTPIPDETFRVHDANHSLSPELAMEFMSLHSNTVPVVHDAHFTRSARNVDNEYQLLLQGAAPVDAQHMELLGSVKQRAMSLFDNPLMSSTGPFTFQPTYATPINWYDITQEGNWTQVHIDRHDNPPPVPVGHPVDPGLLKWRVAPTVAPPVHSSPISDDRLMSHDLLRPHRLQSIIVAQSFRPAVAADLVTESQTVRLANISTFDRARLSQPIGVPAEGGASVTDPPRLSADTIHILLDQQRQNSTEKPVSSDGFTIDLKFCLIELRRPWMSDALFSLPGWYVPGFTKGTFSSGQSDMAGLLGVIPTACIVIRDLRITANWSEADRAVIESSGDLGSFNLFGGTFDRNTAALSVPGMQSFAWICQPLPVLPPADSPPAT